VLIELFSLGVTAEALRANIGSKSAISLQRGPVEWVDPKFQVEGIAQQPSPKTRLNVLSYGIKIWTDLSSVLSQFTRLTDGRTGSSLIAMSRLHSMQRGKKVFKLLRVPYIFSKFVKFGSQLAKINYTHGAWHRAISNCNWRAPFIYAYSLKRSV